MMKHVWFKHITYNKFKIMSPLIISTITGDMLDEPTAIVEGYNSYFSFSKKRSGYSGEFEEVMFSQKFWCKK